MSNEVKEDVFIPKTKHKGLKILLGVLILGILALGGYFLYKDKFCNPTNTVITILEDSQKEFNKVSNKNDKYKINGLVKVEANISKEYEEITNILNNLDLQFSGNVDSKNSLANITLNAKYKKEQLIDVKTYYENNNLYLLLDGLYDKYLKVDTDSSKTKLVPSKTELDPNDFKIIANSLSKASIKVFEKQKFVRSEESITINGKSQDVYNNYLNLDGNGYKALYKDLLTILGKDTEFVTALEKISGAKFNADKEIESINNKEIKATYKFNFYTTKNMLNPKLVSLRMETTEENVTSSINIDKVSDDEMIIAINSNGMVMSCTVKKNDSVFNMNLSVNAMGATIKLELSTNFEKINEFTKVDVSSSKKLEELTEQETQAITEKLQKNKGLVSFIQDVYKLSALQP